MTMITIRALIHKAIATATAAFVLTGSIEGCKPKKRARVESAPPEQRAGFLTWTLTIKPEANTPADQILQCRYSYENTLGWFREQAAASTQALFRQVAQQDPNAVKNVNLRPLTGAQINAEAARLGKVAEAFSADAVAAPGAKIPSDEMLGKNEIIIRAIQGLDALNQSTLQWNCPPAPMVAQGLAAAEQQPGFKKRVIFDNGVTADGREISGPGSSAAQTFSLTGPNGGEAALFLGGEQLAGKAIQEGAERGLPFLGKLVKGFLGMADNVGDDAIHAVQAAGNTAKREVGESTESFFARRLQQSTERNAVGALKQERVFVGQGASPIAPKAGAGALVKSSGASSKALAKNAEEGVITIANLEKGPMGQIVAGSKDSAEIQLFKGVEQNLPALRGPTGRYETAPVESLRGMVKGLNEFPGGIEKLERVGGKQLAENLKRLHAMSPEELGSTKGRLLFQETLEGLGQQTFHAPSSTPKATLQLTEELAQRKAGAAAKPEVPGQPKPNAQPGDKLPDEKGVFRADPSDATTTTNKEIIDIEAQVESADLGQIKSSPDAPINPGNPNPNAKGPGFKERVGEWWSLNNPKARFDSWFKAKFPNGALRRAPNTLDDSAALTDDLANKTLKEKTKSTWGQKFRRGAVTLAVWAVAPSVLMATLPGVFGGKQPAEVSLTSNDDVPWLAAENQIDGLSNPLPPELEALKAGLQAAGQVLGKDVSQIMNGGLRTEREALAVQLETQLQICRPISICVASMPANGDLSPCLQRACNDPALNGP